MNYMFIEDKQKMLDYIKIEIIVFSNTLATEA